MSYARPYQEVVDDLTAVRAQIAKAIKAEQVGAGDKLLRRNLKEMRLREQDLLREISKYNADGTFKGRRIVYGVPA